jgi:hypothetical protein
MTKLKWLFTPLVALPLIVSCNVYSPLSSEKEVEDYLEAAQKCLHDNDYGCAITKYNKLPAGETKDQKLCLVYLAQGGLKLSSLINTVTTNSSAMMGALAQTMVPWTQAKSDAMDNAKIHCVNYGVSAGTAGASNAALLKSLAYFSHCAIRIAKTDRFVATSNTDTACNTASPTGNGVITQDDVGPAGGAISTSSPGMCAADVASCLDDISRVDSSALSSANLNDIKTANDAIPSALKTSTTVTNDARSALRGTTPAS